MGVVFTECVNYWCSWCYFDLDGHRNFSIERVSFCWRWIEIVEEVAYIWVDVDCCFGYDLMISILMCSLMVGMFVIEWMSLVLVLAGTLRILRSIWFCLSLSLCWLYGLVTVNGSMLYWILERIMALYIVSRCWGLIL